MRVEGQAPVRPVCPHCTRTQISGTISCEFALRYAATLLHNVRQMVVEATHRRQERETDWTARSSLSEMQEAALAAGAADRALPLSANE
jgi:hypothetical protein